jgi:hypothetical protein
MDEMKLTLVPAHTLVDEVLIDIVGTTGAETEIDTAFDVALVLDTHVAFDVNTQVTTSLLFIVEDVNISEFVPTFVPFTFHWYAGVVPPLVGVAENVTDVPVQIVVLFADIDTEAFPGVVMVIFTAFEVAVEVVAHDALDVITQVTTALLVNVVEL